MTPPAATAAARTAPARRAAPAPRPRRVSGPAARPAAVPRRQPGRRTDLPGGARLLAWLRALPDHRLLDRLIGGRVWIVLIGGLLVGIVTMQLSLLRLNAGIGVAVERAGELEQRNAALRTTVSRLSDSARIVAVATEMGYVTPPQGSPRFLTASAADAGRALTTMRVPSQDPATIQPALGTTVDPAATTTTTAVADTTSETPTTTTTAAADTTAPATDTSAVAPVTPTSAATDTTSSTTSATSTPVAAAGGAAPAVGPQG